MLATTDQHFRGVCKRWQTACLVVVDEVCFLVKPMWGVGAVAGVAPGGHRQVHNPLAGCGRTQAHVCGAPPQVQQDSCRSAAPHITSLQAYCTCLLSGLQLCIVFCMSFVDTCLPVYGTALGSGREHLLFPSNFGGMPALSNTVMVCLFVCLGLGLPACLCVCLCLQLDTTGWACILLVVPAPLCVFVPVRVRS